VEHLPYPSDLSCNAGTEPVGRVNAESATGAKPIHYDSEVRGFGRTCGRIDERFDAGLSRSGANVVRDRDPPVEHDRAPVYRKIRGCDAEHAKRFILCKIGYALKFDVDRKERERSDSPWRAVETNYARLPERDFRIRR
jgi:hypothetical protein